MSRAEEVGRGLAGVAIAFAFVSAGILLLLGLAVPAFVVAIGGALGFVAAARRR